MELLRGDDVSNNFLFEIYKHLSEEEKKGVKMIWLMSDFSREKHEVIS